MPFSLRRHSHSQGSGSHPRRLSPRLFVFVFGAFVSIAGLVNDLAGFSKLPALNVVLIVGGLIAAVGAVIALGWGKALSWGQAVTALLVLLIGCGIAVAGVVTFSDDQV